MNLSAAATREVVEETRAEAADGLDGTEAARYFFSKEAPTEYAQEVIAIVAMQDAVEQMRPIQISWSEENEPRVKENLNKLRQTLSNAGVAISGSTDEWLSQMVAEARRQGVISSRGASH